MKVYEDFKGPFIRLNKPENWKAGTEFEVVFKENSIILVKNYDEGD